MQFLYNHSICVFFRYAYNSNCDHNKRLPKQMRKNRRRRMNMNCRNGYEVRLVDKQIVLTKDFARKAADAMSKQYATLMQVCAAYPTFTVVKYTINQKVGREKYGKLDYKNMEALIKEWVSENTEAALEEFEKIKREAACASGSYGIVKKWFLGKYKAQYIALHKAENC